MTPTKVEIKLKKAEASTWARLDYLKSKPISNETNKSKDSKDKHLNVNNSGVESVDLEDLLWKMKNNGSIKFYFQMVLS